MRIHENQESNLDSLDEVDARKLLSQRHFCVDADSDDWVMLDRPKGAFGFEQGLLDADGNSVGLSMELIFYRSPQTNLITVKMSVFHRERRKPPLRVYQLHITTKSYDPDNWHDEAHEHFGNSRSIIKAWKNWRSFHDALNFFSQQTNIEFTPELDDPEQLRLKP